MGCILACEKESKALALIMDKQFKSIDSMYKRNTSIESVTKHKNLKYKTYFFNVEVWKENGIYLIIGRQKHLSLPKICYGSSGLRME